MKPANAKKTFQCSFCNHPPFASYSGRRNHIQRQHAKVAGPETFKELEELSQVAEQAKEEHDKEHELIEIIADRNRVVSQLAAVIRAIIGVIAS